MTKRNLSHDQKRKAKLAKRAKHGAPQTLAYDGRKYQADEWVPHVSQTEIAIYEAIQLSERRLTNTQVRLALTGLVQGLRAGKRALLAEDEPDVPFEAGREVEFLTWNIRRHWVILVQKEGPVLREDLVGILRTLLNSIEAHEWNTGPQRGYVAFLEGFMGRFR